MGYLSLVLLVVAALCGVASAVEKQKPWVYSGIGIVLLSIVEAIARYGK